MKIFEIGVMKTGTTSLGKAFEILGFKHMGWSKEAHDKFYQSNKNHAVLFEIIDQYDAFEDGPWHDCDFSVLDKQYPNSKFIILERDNQTWIRSVERQTSPALNINNINPNHLNNRWLTDRENLIKEKITWKTEKYNKIKLYFKERPNDLLVMNIEEGWKPLCHFLNKPIPNVPFPKLNKSSAHCVRDAIKFDKIGDTANAIAKFQQAINMDADQEEWVYARLGKLYIKTDRIEQAKKIYTTQIKIYPNSSRGYQELALITQEEKQWETTLELWESCFIHYKEEIPVWCLIKKAYTLLELHKLKAAKALFEEAKNKQPNNVWSYEGLIKIAQKMEDSKTELAITRKLIALFPKHSIDYFRYGVLLRELGYYEEAETCFQTILSTTKNDNQKILEALAWTASMGKNYDIAAKRWKELNTNFPNIILYKKRYIIALIEILKFEEAQAFYEQHLPQHDNNPDYLIAQVQIYWLNEQKDKASKEIKQLRTIYPTHFSLLKENIRSLIDRFKTSSNTNYIHQALAELENFKGVFPDNQYLITSLNLYLLLDQKEKALQLIDQIPDDTKLRELMKYKAWAAHYTEDLPKAKAIWEEIIKWHPVPQVYPIKDETLKRLDQIDITTKDNAILQFILIRNELQRLPWFLEYYRSLGVERFFFVDNNSTDGTTEYLLKQKDVHVFWTDQNFSQAYCGMQWINELIAKYGQNAWCLHTDMDEILVFPGIEKRSIKHLLTYLNDGEYEAVHGFMLDMYTDNVEATNRSEIATDLLQTYPLFSSKYHWSNSAICPYQHITGGIRCELFKTHELQTKTPIIRGGKNIKYLLSAHQITPARMSDVSCVLLHFKLTGNFKVAFENDLTMNSRPSYCRRRYQTYTQFLQNQSITFGTTKHSHKYQSSQQLVQLGLMQTSSNFESGVYDFKVEKLLELAQSYLKSKQPKRAIACYKAILKQTPNASTSVHYKLGELLLSEQLLEEAKLLYLQLKTTYPDKSNGYTGLANTFRAQKDWQKCLETWEECFKVFADNTQPYWYIRKGEAHFELQQFEKALTLFELCTNLYPNNIHGFIGSAKAAKQAKQYQKALKYWQTCMERFPSDIQPYWHKQRQHILLELGQINEAQLEALDLLENQKPVYANHFKKKLNHPKKILFLSIIF